MSDTSYNALPVDQPQFDLEPRVRNRIEIRPADQLYPVKEDKAKEEDIDYASGFPIPKEEVSKAKIELPVGDKTITLTPISHDPFGGQLEIPDLQDLPRPIKTMFGIGGAERYQFWPERMVRSALSLPGDVSSGRTLAIDPETGHVSNELLERAQDMAGLAGTGGFGIQRNAAGVFGGRLSKTANLEKLTEAQEMAVKGIQPAAIWDATGWFRGADNKWKYEIPDAAAKLDPQGVQGLRLGQEQIAPAFIQHDALYEAYPELKNMTVDKNVSPGSEGTSYGGRIGLNENLNPLSMKSIALHEIQHEIQNIEGFAKGGAPIATSPAILDALRGHNLALSDAIAIKAMIGRGLSEADAIARVKQQRGSDYQPSTDQLVKADMGNLLKLHKEVGETLADPSGYKEYKRLAGEVEARNVQNRELETGNSSAFPLEQQARDVPTDQQIVRGVKLKSDSGEVGKVVAAMKEPFYSAIENAVSGTNQKTMPSEQWLSTIANKPGVKPEELEWTGLKSWLQEQKGLVSKQEIESFINENKVKLEEVVKGNQPLANRMQYTLTRNGEAIAQGDEIAAARWRNESQPGDTITQELVPDQAQRMRGDNTKYSKYQLPGGENYREMLLTLPEKKKNNSLLNENLAKIQANRDPATHDALMAERNRLIEDNNTITQQQYRSSHWDEPNVLAHIRMNDRIIDGKKSLHVEEVQSDWHQQGREKGYQDPEKIAKDNARIEEINQELRGKVDPKTGELWMPGRDEARALASERAQLESANMEAVPNAPFKKTWTDLAIKRIIREAAEKGYDRISWTPGEAQAARYDLSKQVSRIVYDPKSEMLRAEGLNGADVLNRMAKPEQISDYIGKEAAKKLLETEKSKGVHTLEGLDLKVGGEGMKEYYDKIFANKMSNISKEKVKSAEVETNPGYSGRIQLLTKTGEHVKDFSSREEAHKWAEDQNYKRSLYQLKEAPAIPPIKQPVLYIDVPQSLKDTALNKGFSLFAKGGIPLVPVDGDPFVDAKPSKDDKHDTFHPSHIGARQAPDGHYYIEDGRKGREGKYIRIIQ